MSSNRRIKRDDFDIEARGTSNDRNRKMSRSSELRKRSRSRKRSYSRRKSKLSHSRSRSEERRRNRRGRDSYSPTRSRSRSKSRSRGNSRYTSRHHHASRQHRNSRSKSYSRSRSRSQSYAPRHRYRDNGCRNKYREGLRSRSRSRSRSSSHFRDFGNKSSKNDNQSTSLLQNTPLPNTQEENINTKHECENLEDLPLPQQESSNKSFGIYHFDDDEPIDRERIHREMEEKLRAELAKEGKVYPPPKSEPSHPVFANDGSFLEIFKKMQQAQASTSAVVANVKPIIPSVPAIVATANPTTATYLAATATGKSAPPPPIVGRRRGGKILKTGVVAKPKIQTDANSDPKDFWSLYLAEVNKYKNTACESEQGNRPLVK